MDLIYSLFGEGKELNVLQMSMRSLIAFLITLILIRIAGIRTFGKRSGFDNVVTIMLGAILSRTVAGASPFLPTVAASLVLVLVHRLIGRLTYRHSVFSKLVKSEAVCLYKNGAPLYENMKQTDISLHDMEEAIRMQLHKDSFDGIKAMYIERTGSISIVLTPNQDN